MTHAMTITKVEETNHWMDGRARHIVAVDRSGEQPVIVNAYAHHRGGCLWLGEIVIVGAGDQIKRISSTSSHEGYTVGQAADYFAALAYS